MSPISEENTVSGLYTDQDSEENFLDEEPGVWNIFFFPSSHIQKRIACSSVTLDCNAAPVIKDDFSLIEYSKDIFTKFVGTLLVKD